VVSQAAHPDGSTVTSGVTDVARMTAPLTVASRPGRNNTYTAEPPYKHMVGRAGIPVAERINPFYCVPLYRQFYLRVILLYRLCCTYTQ
jgi:hypothetical protein